mgnify:CR=1 FL=1
MKLKSTFMIHRYWQHENENLNGKFWSILKCSSANLTEIFGDVSILQIWRNPRTSLEEHTSPVANNVTTFDCGCADLFQPLVCTLDAWAFNNARINMRGSKDNRYLIAVSKITSLQEPTQLQIPGAMLFFQSVSVFVGSNKLKISWDRRVLSVGGKNKGRSTGSFVWGTYQIPPHRTLVPIYNIFVIFEPMENNLNPSSICTFNEAKGAEHWT